MTPLPTSPALGAPVWVDLSTPDRDGAQDFYSRILGWTFSEPAEEFGGYIRASSVDGEVAGIGPVMDGGFPAWTLYFRTDDAAGAAASIAATGGTVVMPPMPIGPLGTMVVAQDPTGAFFGLWQNGEMTGFEQYGEPGAMAWCDLRSPDPDAARAFYGPLLDWTFTPLEMAGPSYTTVTVTDSADPVGGVGDFMGIEGVPPHWAVYFVCADVDAAVTALQELGGQAFAPPFDSPYGRMCPVADPYGAAFWLMSLSAS